MSGTPGLSQGACSGASCLGDRYNFCPSLPRPGPDQIQPPGAILTGLRYAGALKFVPADARASPLLYNRWVKQANGVKASAHRKVPLHNLIEAHFTRETGGVFEPSHQKGSPARGRFPRQAQPLPQTRNGSSSPA